MLHQDGIGLPGLWNFGQTCRALSLSEERCSQVAWICSFFPISNSLNLTSLSKWNLQRDPVTRLSSPLVVEPAYPTVQVRQGWVGRICCFCLIVAWTGALCELPCVALMILLIWSNCCDNGALVWVIIKIVPQTEFEVYLVLGCAQVPIEGEKEGGVEWVADQAAITVQELREVERMELQIWRVFLSKVVRRLAHGERKGRAPHGLPFIAIWILPYLPWQSILNSCSKIYCHAWTISMLSL